MSVLRRAGLALPPLVTFFAPLVARAQEAATDAVTTVTEAATAVAETVAAAAPVPVADTGDTAWMIVATALVLMMTIPGLALFYSGLVKRESVLSTLMQSFATCCIASIVWVVIGYSLVFTGDASTANFIGDASKAMLAGVELGSLSGTIPETVFIMFQMTFAIITPALIFGAVADRMNFAAMCLFVVLWLLAVYVPVAHWVWGPGGFIGGTGMSGYAGFLGLGTMLDFAGGAVVHINAGVAGLVCALVLGRRKGYGSQPFLPNNLVLSVIGASLLWVGWFGFNAGSAVASGGRAGMAMLVTQVATAAAAISWVVAEWVFKKKPSVLGAISGAVAGLVAITPASGFVDVKGALIIGLISGAVCLWCSSTLKAKLKYDDSLDVFGIHGVGGILGSILTGILCVESIGGIAPSTGQLIAQIVGTVVVMGYSAVATFVILMLIKPIAKLRVDEETEFNGLDLAMHGEKVH